VEEQKAAAEVDAARLVSICLLVIDVFVLVALVIFSWTFGTFVWPRVFRCVQVLGADSSLPFVSSVIRPGLSQIALLLAAGLLVIKERLVRRTTISLVVNVIGGVACVVYAAFYAVMFVGAAYAPIAEPVLGTK